MSFIDAYKSYGALTEEQKQFLRDKKVDTELPPDSWIAFLKGVAGYDRHGDALRKVIGWIAAIGIILGFILTVATEQVLFLLVVMIGLVSLAFFFVLRRVDVPNLLREFVLPFVTLIREDMAADELLHLRIDLSGGTKQEKRKSDQKFEQMGRKIRECWYDDSWMTGNAKLADGTALQWEINDYIREREITKRNPRGKTKTKTKHKVKRTFDVRVGLRGDEYALTDTASKSALGKMSIKQGDRRNVIRTQHRTVTTTLQASPDVNDLLGPIAAAYQRVSLKQEQE